MSKPVKVLIVEDSEDDAKLALRALRQGGFSPTHRRVQTKSALKEALAHEPWDAVISDFQMPSFTGMDALGIFRSTGLDIPFILVSGTIGEELAVDAMKAGASDYVMKNGVARLAPALERELKETQTRADHRLVEQALTDSAKRAEIALRKSEAEFRTMAEAMPQIVWITAPDYSNVYFNQHWMDYTGLTLAASRGDGWNKAFHSDDRPRAQAAWQQATATTATYTVESRLRRADGVYRWWLVRAVPLQDAAGNILKWLGTCTDIHDLKVAELEIVGTNLALRENEIRIKRLNRVYAMLSGIHSLISRVRDREELFREACRIAVQSGQFPLAWVAVADPLDQLVKPVAWAGDEGGFLHLTRPSVGVKGYGKAGLSAQALAERVPIVCNDIEGNGSAMRYAKGALERGYRSAAALPLVVDGTAIGTFVLYAAEIGFFDDEEMKLLVELVSDIAFALDNIEKEKKVRRLTRVHAVLTDINAAIVRIRDRGELFRESCRIAVDAGGLQLAWIGVVDAQNGVIVPAASSGPEKGLMDVIRFSTREDDGQLGMSGRAVRSRAPIVSNDVLADKRVRFGAESVHRGLRSLAMIPLMADGEAIAILGLHAAEAAFFDQDEMKLLTEVAGNITFALEHIDKEQKVARLTRVHEMLSGINTLIVRVRDRDELFREACRIAVAHGRFKMAWIGVVDESAAKLVLASSTSADPGFFDDIEPRLSLADDAPAGHGPPAIAARTKQPVIVNDVAGDPRIRSAKRHADRGIHSLVSLPLMIADQVVAVIVLHAAEAGFFDEEEMRLLTELAGNIAFAIDHIDKHEKVARLTRVHAMLSGVNSLIVRVRDRDDLFREACRIAMEHGRFRMAWIGVVDRRAMKVVLAASAGTDPEFLELIKDKFSLRDDAPLGNTMTARAIREKKAFVSNEIRSDPKVLFAKERFARGIHSMAVLPLLVSDDAVGVLALYADEAGFFDDEEMTLLTELVGNIAFAIDNIDKQERLDYLAYYDVLTGLANRSLFLERLAQYMRSAGAAGHSLALHLIDLERFKNINDTLGRPAGDALLRQVAEWLTSNVGDASLLARVGADHFVMVVPAVKHEADVARMLEKTMAAFLEHPFSLNEAAFRIAAKIGVALFPEDGTDAETLFKNAEAALKKAKVSGDRYVFYTQKMTTAVAGKLTLENQLRQAFDNDEFVLHYQPKISLLTGKLTGAEALLRWNDPRTGLVPPMRFIPILEETGLIHEVGRWALRKAIADYLRWRAAGLAAVRIAVNVSPLQLRHRGFTAEVEQAIGIDPQAAAGLELEITENMIMEDVKQSNASLEAIRAMGVRIAIDDFGTGFSSLGYLSKLPVDTLKIDRSFVVDMTASPQGLALVSTIITLARSLKLKVVAEGVETEEQSHLLGLLSCDEMQGYLFSKPVPGEVFEARFLAPASVTVRSLGRPHELSRL